MPIGRHLDRLLLLCRSRDEVSAYEAYPAPASDVAVLPPGRLAVRLRRLDDLGVLLRTGKKPSKQRRTGKQQQQQQLLLQQQSELQQQLHGKHARLLVPFEDIGGYRGLFVGGVRPHFLVVSPSGQAYSHPMFVDGSVCAFSPFDRHFCRHGFLYLTPERDLRVASLPDDYDYASPWPRKRVPLGRTVHCVQFHRATSTYLVASSAPELSNAICRLSSDGDKEIDTREVPPTHCLPFRDRYYFEAYTPRLAGDTRCEAGYAGVGTGGLLQNCPTAIGETAEGFKELVAVATNLSYNEEITCKGTITLMDVINVVPEPGQPLTAYKMKLAFREEQKGPVTALASCHGLLVSAIGQKVYLWQLKDDRLVGIAFVDSEILIHSINCVKNLIVTSDLAKSVQLLRYQPSVRVLSIVARDSARRQVFTSNFLVDGQNLGFLLCDSRRNLLAFAYDPSEKLSRGWPQSGAQTGGRLPSSVHCSLRVHNCLRGGAGLAKTRDIQQGHSVVMGTAEGGLYLLTPVRRPVYTRLIMLEKHLSHAVLHPAGLHPRASRIYSPANHDLEPAKSGIIDGDLMYRYVSLGHSERVEVAKKSRLKCRRYPG
uniref:CPSF_A domain-containing protein n=1 Tax=Macrostomum lignano TaxID=282301 RepID=A0A1I8FEZ4_9PLAT